MRDRANNSTISSLLIVVALLTFSFSQARAIHVNINGPPGSSQFGYSVSVLPNGNFVVTDPFFDEPGGAVDIGAVYLYSGVTRNIISALKGTRTSDQTGDSGVTVLTNGNFVVKSPHWDNPVGPTANVGAVTWCNMTTGCNGSVSVSNSLIGGTLNDGVDQYVTVLPSGNYVVTNPFWTNPAGPSAAGAFTWCSGELGCTGIIDSSNSLVFRTPGDWTGRFVKVLSNGNYVVVSPEWDNPTGPVGDVGAATWCSGTAGCTGAVSSSNSLVGGRNGDGQSQSVTALTNGNYVVNNPYWTGLSGPNLTGAATWCSGATGCVGTITSANSLVGGTAGDGFSHQFVTALTNGNYVVSKPEWDNPTGPVGDVGAATWCSGTAGCTGLVTSSNSLVGGRNGDGQSQSVTALTNGNYVVNNPYWTGLSGPNLTGAATWCSGATGCVGTITSANSLVGGTAGDGFSHQFVTALTNGNYVVSKPEWDNPTGPVGDVGAATWCSGTAGCTGLVTSSNSLVGGRNGDGQSQSVTALTNGNYVVNNPYWTGLSGPNLVGAATWCSGVTGCTGTITSTNSLVGGTAGDGFRQFVTALTNGNYVVSKPEWDNPTGPVGDAGAVAWCSGNASCTGTVSSSNSLVGTAGYGTSQFVTALNNGNYVAGTPSWTSPSGPNVVGAATWCSGVTGCTGNITASNSLVGGATADRVGQFIIALINGNYVVRSPGWDNPTGPVGDAGAVSLGNGTNGTNGLVSSTNSVLGTVSSGGASLVFDYDAALNLLYVGRRSSNIVTILDAVSTPRAFFDFDGDGKTDIGIFRPGPGEWWYQRSSDLGVRAGQFGVSTDRITPGDFTGDGKTDIAFWRPGTGEWFILRSEDSTFFAFPFGSNGDIPAPADYDADGRADAAVFRPSTTTWFILNSGGGGTSIVNFGLSTDKPVVADYDGDAKADIAIWRAGPGEWWVRRSSNDSIFAVQFGVTSDRPVQGDFTGDGKADIAFWRPADGNWFVVRSEDSSFFAFPFGSNGDVPVPGDYDGDGRQDAAVFRPSSATWFLNRSTAGIAIQPFGLPTDTPIPSAFVP